MPPQAYVEVHQEEDATSSLMLNLSVTNEMASSIQHSQNTVHCYVPGLHIDWLVMLG
jgi:hypothetical protein